ncbi:uncharacterized protein C22orf15 homolog isoform X4 [Marmota monax]|uniref:uncharacterized protein C22orf15 homolog isoform X4 n=1 Tax=Marmota monax TaxID=9995 RepID=UPI001EAFFF13|nr:uncharacterized protein C22orf15 homolog isoform X4 [Marmota monax]
MFVTVMFGVPRSGLGSGPCGNLELCAPVIHICQDGWMSAKKFMQNCLDYGAWAGYGELVNPWCSLMTLTAHLKQRGQVPQDASLHAFPETIALLAEDGQLVSLGEDLEEKTSPASSKGSPLLQERGTYVLVKIIKELRWLSGISTMGNGRRRRMSTRRSHRELEPPSRAGRVSSLPSRTR